MGSEFKTRVLTEAAQLSAIAPEWTSLCERCPRATPFQRPEWIVSWAETFSPETIRVIEVRLGSSLIGLAPLLIYPRGEERVLAFMAGGISDYLDLLVDPEYESEVTLAMFQAIEELDRWTKLDLTDLSSCSVLHHTMLAQRATPHDQCSSVQLPNTSEELLHRLSKRQRANLRQAHSRIQKAGGQLELSRQETLSEFLDDLFRLHAMRWLTDEGPGVLDEKIKSFHGKAAPGLQAAGIMRLYRLRLRQQTVAVIYTLRDPAKVFCYLQAYDPSFKYLSPGTSLMFSAMEDARVAGRTKFDLLRGQETYKQHWRVRSEPTYRIQMSRELENIFFPPNCVAA